MVKAHILSLPRSPCEYTQDAPRHIHPYELAALVLGCSGTEPGTTESRPRHSSPNTEQAAVSADGYGMSL